MDGKHIHYFKIKSYKYKLAEDHEYTLPAALHPDAAIQEPAGRSLKAGYCWDGPSGPTIDTGAAGTSAHCALSAARNSNWCSTTSPVCLRIPPCVPWRRQLFS